MLNAGSSSTRSPASEIISWISRWRFNSLRSDAAFSNSFSTSSLSRSAHFASCRAIALITVIRRSGFCVVRAIARSARAVSNPFSLKCALATPHDSVKYWRAVGSSKGHEKSARRTRMLTRLSASRTERLSAASCPTRKREFSTVQTSEPVSGTCPTAEENKTDETNRNERYRIIASEENGMPEAFRGIIFQYYMHLRAKKLQILRARFAFRGVQ